MNVRHIVHHLQYFNMLALAVLIAAGCVPSQPQVSASPTDLKKSREALEAAKQKSRDQCLSDLEVLPETQKRYFLKFALDELNYAKSKGKGARCPDKFAILEKQYLEARALFYACQNKNAADLARYIICEVSTLKCPNTKPVAKFTAPSEAKVNDLITFNAAPSYDPDKDSLTYIWNFGDETKSSGAGPVMNHRYTKIGYYKVRLTVDDNKGGQDTYQQTLRIVDLKIVGNKLLFDFNKATLRASVKTALAELVQLLLKNPGYHAKLTGYTDSTGSEDYNLRLSEKRALAVKKYLVNQGIARQRITTEARGESEPIANNNTKEGRQKNRRTEITLTLVSTLK